MKKTITFLLLTAMLATAMSCGSEPSNVNPEGKTAGENGETTEALTGRESVSEIM